MPDLSQKINTLVQQDSPDGSPSMLKVFMHLIDRWEEEREYEDFKLYRQSFKDSIPPEFKYKSMRQSPFQAEFVHLESKAVCKLKASKSKITFTISQ